MKNHIIAATLAMSAMGTQASEVFQKEQIRIDDPRVTTMCKEFQNKTGILLNGKEICEYSVDNGKSWITTTNVAYAVAALLWLGASAYGMIRLRRRRNSDLKLVKPTNIISDLQGESNEQNNWEITYNIFDPDKQEEPVKRVSELIENKRFYPAELKLNMTLKSHPERTDLHIKKLELYFTQWDTEKFEETYSFIIHTIDPLKALIPHAIHERMKDWGREIDPTNQLYKKTENWAETSADEQVSTAIDQEVAIIPQESQVTTPEEAEIISTQVLDMADVKEKLREENLDSEQEAEVKVELSNRPKDMKLLSRLITHTIERYGFEYSENEENITLNAWKPESILYYLDKNDEVTSGTEFSIWGVVKVATLGKWYIEIITRNPEFKKIKILLTAPGVK